jgi:hypothetical protein
MLDTVASRNFRAENFPRSDETPWLDRQDWGAQIKRRLAAGAINEAQANHCRRWAQDGYVILEGFFAPRTIDAAWNEYERAIATGLVTPPEDKNSVGNTLPGRILNPHFKVKAFNRILTDRKARSLVSLLLGRNALPFQTISGHKGSEQLAHSDSIHMSTHPEGYLAANWIAFEDISPDSGPLVYYPGSHRLPYIYSRECGISIEEAQTDYLTAYAQKYEPFIQQLIADNHLEPRYFLPKKGDVLFWHANLLHGGSKMNDGKSSRRALVCHYFAEGIECFHDLTGTSSQLPPPPSLFAKVSTAFRRR